MRKVTGGNEMNRKIWKFYEIENAISFQNHAIKPMWIMLGDDNRYWVVIPALAATLEKAGYQYAI